MLHVMHENAALLLQPWQEALAALPLQPWQEPLAVEVF
jgi:hypothetical protein